MKLQSRAKKQRRTGKKSPTKSPKQLPKCSLMINLRFPAGRYFHYCVYIDISGKERNLVSGRVVETAGYDINFYVFDQKGFNTWREGKSAPMYVNARRVNSYYYSFVPDYSDYYFVLDNTYSWFTNKVPQITASWSYQTTVTEYRDVQKTRTVTEYVKVTKTKYVSLFQLLTGTK